MAVLDPNNLSFYTLLSETVTVGGTAVAANRLIRRTGAYPSSGGYAAGVTMQAGAATKNVGIATDGIYPVEVGAAIAAIDTPLFADATGKVRPVTDAATQYQVGRALDTATGTGVEFILVKLTPR